MMLITILTTSEKHMAKIYKTTLPTQTTLLFTQVVSFGTSYVDIVTQGYIRIIPPINTHNRATSSFLEKI